MVSLHLFVCSCVSRSVVEQGIQVLEVLNVSVASVGSNLVCFDQSAVSLTYSTTYPLFIHQSIAQPLCRLIARTRMCRARCLCRVGGVLVNSAAVLLPTVCNLGASTGATATAADTIVLSVLITIPPSMDGICSGYCNQNP